MSVHPINRRRRGFTLVELMIAILVLGMGLVMLAAIFPAGIAQQQFANDDIFGRVVADHAISVIRSKVKPDDFGTYEQFYLFDQRATGAGGSPELPYRLGPTGTGGFARGIPGDWGWKRPGFVFDDASTTTDEGKIDIFSWEATRLGPGGVSSQWALALGMSLLTVNPGPAGVVTRATEFPEGLTPAAAEVPPLFQPVTNHRLYGIPYNRERYDSDLIVGTAEAEVYGYGAGNAPLRRSREPAAFILQSERTWPQGAGTRTSPGQYYWDCMFRRFQGKMYVAIFVYRVAPPGGEPRRYSVARASVDPGLLGQPQGNQRLPPLPVTVRLDNGSNQGGAKAVWTPLTDIAPNTAPPPAAGGAFNPAAQYDGWQLPGQWVLDKFNNVHRVVNGRRVPANGPVRFARPISQVAPVPALVGQAVGPTLNEQGTETIDQIWYLPGRDAAGNALIPVFCTVQEL